MKRTGFGFAAVCALLLGVLFASPGFAQEAKYGLGVEAENISFTYLEGEEYFDVRTLSTTPAFMFTIRATPNFFIEPLFGFHTTSGEVVDTREWGSSTEEMSFRDLALGVGALYAFSPENFVSPYINGKIGFHFLYAEETYKWVDFDDPEFSYTSDSEVSATAIKFSAGLGGMMNIKEHVFLTLEARLSYARLGDPERKSSGGGEDTVESKSSTFATDMVLGLRVLF